MIDRWELVAGGLERLAVPGGWIYRDPTLGQLVYVPHPALSVAPLGSRLPGGVAVVEGRAA